MYLKFSHEVFRLGEQVTKMFWMIKSGTSEYMLANWENNFDCDKLIRSWTKLYFNFHFVWSYLIKGKSTWIHWGSITK